MALNAMDNHPEPVSNLDGDTDIEEDEYAVEKIVDKRINRRTNATEYFVKWENYDHSDNTWEPVEHLKCPDLIVQFEEEREKEKQKAKEVEKERAKRRRSSSASTQESQSKRLRKEDRPGTSKMNEPEILLEEAHGETADDEEEDKEDKDDTSSSTDENSSIDGSSCAQNTGFGRGLPIESIVGSCTDDDQNVGFFIKWKGADGMDLVDVIEIEERAPRELCVWYRNRLYTSIKRNPPTRG